MNVTVRIGTNLGARVLAGLTETNTTPGHGQAAAPSGRRAGAPRRMSRGRAQALLLVPVLYRSAVEYISTRDAPGTSTPPLAWSAASQTLVRPRADLRDPRRSVGKWRVAWQRNVLRSEAIGDGFARACQVAALRVVPFQRTLRRAFPLVLPRRESSQSRVGASAWACKAGKLGSRGGVPGV